MGKTLGEYLKLTVVSILSVFMTLVVMSGTVIKNKADKTYVDKEDSKLDVKIESVKTDYKKECEVLKADFLREVTQIKNSQNTTQSDIKKILEKI